MLCKQDCKLLHRELLRTFLCFHVHRVLHRVGGDDAGVVVAGVRVDAVGEEADADFPLDHVVEAAGDPPDPGHPHPVLAVLLLEVEAFQVAGHRCRR